MIRLWILIITNNFRIFFNCKIKIFFIVITAIIFWKKKCKNFKNNLNFEHIHIFERRNYFKSSRFEIFSIKMWSKQNQKNCVETIEKINDKHIYSQFFETNQFIEMIKYFCALAIIVKNVNFMSIEINRIEKFSFDGKKICMLLLFWIIMYWSIFWFCFFLSSLKRISKTLLM